MTENINRAIIVPIDGGNIPVQHTIAKSKLPDFRTKFDGLCKKAEKFGIETPTYQIVGEGDVTHRYPNNKRFTVRTVNLEIHMPDKKIAYDDNGFEFMGVIDIVPVHNGDGTYHYDNSITAAEGFYKTFVELFGDSNGRRCDECERSLPRSKQIIIQTHTSEIKVIGGNCIRNYIGFDLTHWLNFWRESDRIFDMLDVEEYDDSNFGSFDSNNWHLNPLDFLAGACAVIRRDNGYWFKSDHERSTRDGVLPLLRKGGLIEDSDWDLAKEIIEYYSSLEDPNEFDFTIQRIVLRGIMTEKELGIMAYAPEGYRRTQEENRNRTESNFQHIGKEGYSLQGLRFRITGIETGTRRAFTGYADETYTIVFGETLACSPTMKNGKDNHGKINVPAGQKVAWKTGRLPEVWAQGAEVFCNTGIKKANENYPRYSGHGFDKKGHPTTNLTRLSIKAKGRGIENAKEFSTNS